MPNPGPLASSPNALCKQGKLGSKTANVRPILYKEWWDVKGELQRLPAGYVPSDPFKPGKPSPLRSLPLGDDPTKAKVDPAHTWAIVGIGKDLYGSAILLGAHMGLFGTGAMKTRLDAAYVCFEQYLVRVQKHTSIDDFSWQTLKCGRRPESLF